MDEVIKYIPPLMRGLGVTLGLFGYTLLFSLPLGFLVCLMRMSRVKLLKNIAGVYIWLLRGSPLILQVVAVYFGLGYMGLPIGRFEAACLAFIINYSAYMAEIFRGGIQSIGRGQHEAADVLGLTRTQTMLQVVLPQAVKRCIPAIGNEYIILIKDTALVYVIGITDLMRVAQNASVRDFVLTPLAIAAVFYLLMNFIMERLLALAEKRCAYYE